MSFLPLAPGKWRAAPLHRTIGSGIGWLSRAGTVRRIETVRHVGGIMNGTCNYILDSMTRLGLGYQECPGQRPGPGLCGRRTLHRRGRLRHPAQLVVSANIAFGVSPPPDFSAVPAAGIRYISDTDVAEFKKHGLVCKLVSCANAYEDGYEAYVEPTLYSPLRRWKPPCPPIITSSLWRAAPPAARLLRPGAGRYPTAYNVVQDCMDFIRGQVTAPMAPRLRSAMPEKCYYIRRPTRTAGWKVTPPVVGAKPSSPSR